MTFLELRVRVSTWLKDKNNGFHTVADVNSYINDAMREVHRLLVQAAQNFFFKCQKAQFVAGACEYFLPSDFIKCERLEVVLSQNDGADVTKALMPISLNEQNNYPQSKGIPDFYCLIGNKIKFFPIPNDDLFIKITYTYRLADMTLDNETPAIPEEFQEMIALLATKSGIITDGEANPRLDEKIQMYMNTLKAAAASRVRQTGRRIIMTNNYDHDGWL